MPETFGSGTAGAGYDERSTPSLLSQIAVPASSVNSTPVNVAGQLFVLLAVDVASGGGGTGGNLILYLDNPTIPFVSFNIGSNTDSFSWRGWLPVSVGRIGWQNNSDANCSLTLSGLNFLATE